MIVNLESRIISRESTQDSWLSESTPHFGIRVFLALRTALHMRREDLLAARMEDGGGDDERFRRQFAMVNHGALKGRSQLQLSYEMSLSPPLGLEEFVVPIIGPLG